MLEGVKYRFKSAESKVQFLENNGSNKEIIAWMDANKISYFIPREVGFYSASDLEFPETPENPPDWFCIDTDEFEFFEEFEEAAVSDEIPSEFIAEISGEIVIKIHNEITRKAVIEHLQRVKFKD
jgi:hypothetical protein